MLNSALIDLDGLCKRYPFKPRTVYGWVRRGGIPHLRAGRMLLFSPPEIDEWLRSHRREVLEGEDSEIVAATASKSGKKRRRPASPPTRIAALPRTRK